MGPARNVYQPGLRDYKAEPPTQQEQTNIIHPENNQSFVGAHARNVVNGGASAANKLLSAFGAPKLDDPMRVRSDLAGKDYSKALGEVGFKLGIPKPLQATIGAGVDAVSGYGEARQAGKGFAASVLDGGKNVLMGKLPVGDHIKELVPLRAEAGLAENMAHKLGTAYTTKLAKGGIKDTLNAGENTSVTERVGKIGLGGIGNMFGGFGAGGSDVGQSRITANLKQPAAIPQATAIASNIPRFAGPASTGSFQGPSSQKTTVAAGNPINKPVTAMAGGLNKTPTPMATIAQPIKPQQPLIRPTANPLATHSA